MNEWLRVLASLLWFAGVPLLGYAIVRLASRRPWLILALLIGVVAVGAGAVVYAKLDGFTVSLETRRTDFHSQAGKWCFNFGFVLLVLGVPALPLVFVAHLQNGEDIGPVGGQWVAVLFGYFMGCAIWGSVFYMLLTGIDR